MSRDYSIVVMADVSEDKGYRCGYCKSSDTNYSDGMWAVNLRVQDYQDLIDRGWRRSGTYCYKPKMELTCCPHYTIKCDALNLKLTKSQKKILKKMNRFLSEGGKMVSDIEREDRDIDNFSDFRSDINLEEKALAAHQDLMLIKSDLVSNNEVDCDPGGTKPNKIQSEDLASSPAISDVPADKSEAPSDTNRSQVSRESGSSSKPNLKTPKCGHGRDMSKPECKKAKLARWERKQEKIKEKGLTVPPPKKASNCEKTLEEFLQPQGDNPAHKLEIKLVSSVALGSDKNFAVEHSLYQKYQFAVHQETPQKTNEESFRRFLVESPLKPFKGKDGIEYGSFHQQYWLDGKLIAVGVIDILPKCLTAVYFFYDPDYSFLTLGTYGSFRELELTRSLARQNPKVSGYYMGYYIHSCPKMRYKARISPSYLLCPETYVWLPVDACLPKLDVAKYSRLDDTGAEPPEVPSINKVLVLFHHEPMFYSQYKRRNPGRNYANKVARYAQLVGMPAALTMLLYMD